VKKQAEESTQEQTQQSSSEITTENKNSEASEEETLPATGVQNLEWYSLLGILLLTISMIFLQKNVYKNKKIG